MQNLVHAGRFSVTGLSTDLMETLKDSSLVLGAGYRVPGTGFRVSGDGFRESGDYGLWTKDYGLWTMVRGAP